MIEETISVAIGLRFSSNDARIKGLTHQALSYDEAVSSSMPSRFYGFRRICAADRS